MSRDQFDDLVTGHLRAIAPREAPARVLDATLDRIASTPQGGAGWRLGRVGGLLAAAAVIVLAVVAGTQLGGLLDGPVGGDPSASPSVAPVESAPFSPSAAPSATPPAPVATEPATADDALLLRVVTLGGPTDPASMLPGITVTVDGTVIWRPVSTTEFAGYLTRRLTTEGLAQFRELVFGDGLLDADATHELEPLPDAEPPGRGGFEHTFTVGEGADQVVVTSVGWMGDEEEATYYQPDPERRALDALANQLRDPESLLGEDAWEGPAAAYEAEEYLLVLTPYRDVPPYGNPDVAEVPLPIDGSLEAFGEAYGDVQPAARCGAIDRDEAAAVVDGLTTLGIGESNSVGMDRATGASLDWVEGNGVVDLWLLPRMPGDYPGCDAQP
ncbi:MAG TPA: hypothetical protein VLA59_09210 [Patescibacteria group bacterium]|nr:hypothetical protein [Patescibacteria group bacterium]